MNGANLQDKAVWFLRRGSPYPSTYMYNHVGSLNMHWVESERAHRRHITYHIYRDLLYVAAGHMTLKLYASPIENLRKSM